jgi:hypothetical protein
VFSNIWLTGAYSTSYFASKLISPPLADYKSTYFKFFLYSSSFNSILPIALLLSFMRTIDPVERSFSNDLSDGNRLRSADCSLLFKFALYFGFSYDDAYCLRTMSLFGCGLDIINLGALVNVE